MHDKEIEKKLQKRKSESDFLKQMDEDTFNVYKKGVIKFLKQFDLAVKLFAEKENREPNKEYQLEILERYKKYLKKSE